MTGPRKPTTAALWITVALVAVMVGYPLAEVNSDEPEKAPTPTADAMHGTEAGQVRDDNSLRMKLVWCPPGEFRMGSPNSEQDRDDNENAVSVTLTQGYWLGKYEVTQSEWKRVMKTEPWEGRAETKEGADFPATFVDWNDATDFCRKLTKLERQAGRLSKGWEYTLPTEAQWERACRARTETKFSFGDKESKLGDFGWFDENASNAGEEYAHKVGRKKSNPWGLFDMHGNVWEWCRDTYLVELPGGRDPAVQTRGLTRVIRGGCWLNDAHNCRSAQRFMDTPVNEWATYGFRVAGSIVRQRAAVEDTDAKVDAPPAPK